jgi:F-type H+-transporting ATPase subunit b
MKNILLYSKNKISYVILNTMQVLIRQGFGFNIDVFDTNILNLAVVVCVVVTFVGDSLRTLLDQRRQIILFALREADQKAIRVQQKLEEARKAVEIARLRSKEIRAQTIQTVEKEKLLMQQQLEDDLRRLQENGRQTIQLERQRVIQSIARQIADTAVTRAESNLMIIFTQQGSGLSKQKELNDIHLRKTLRQLKISIFRS